MRCHTSLPLSSHNPHEAQRAPTTTIDDWPRGPPPGSTVDDEVPLTSKKPAPPGLTNGYEDPSPRSTKAHRQDRSMATTAHNHDRRTATRAHWHLLRQTATGAHDDQRMGNPHPNADASPNATVNQTRTPARTRVPPTASIFMKRATTRAPQFAISAGS